MTKGLLLSGCVAAALCVAACSSSKAPAHGSSAPPTTTATTGTSSGPSTGATGPSSAATGAATGDFSALLIAPDDIPVSGMTLVHSQAIPGARGVAGTFATADGARQLGDTIAVLPSAAAAAAARKAAAAAAAREMAVSTAQDIPLGDGGKAFRGTAAGGSKAVVVVVFSEGDAFVTLEFASAKSDPVPTPVVQQVARAQDAKIKANPPS
jgi:hypothetical protein